MAAGFVTSLAQAMANRSKAGTLQKLCRGSMSMKIQFDYIAAGGRTAGAVTAAHQAEQPDIQIALLQAGPSDENGEKFV